MGAQTTILQALTVVGLKPYLSLLCPAVSMQSWINDILLCQRLAVSCSLQKQTMCNTNKPLTSLCMSQSVSVLPVMLMQACCTCGLVATGNAIFSACVRSTWKPVPNVAFPSSNKLVRMGSNRLWASSHTSLPGRNPFTCNSAAHVCEGLLGLIWELQRKYKPFSWTRSSAVATGLL